MTVANSQSGWYGGTLFTTETIFKRNAKELLLTELNKTPWHFFASNTITV